MGAPVRNDGPAFNPTTTGSASQSDSLQQLYQRLSAIVNSALAANAVQALPPPAASAAADATAIESARKSIQDQLANLSRQSNLG